MILPVWGSETRTDAILELEDIKYRCATTRFGVLHPKPSRVGIRITATYYPVVDPNNSYLQPSAHYPIQDAVAIAVMKCIEL